MTTHTDAPAKIGDRRIINGRWWECYEIELEGDKWWDIGPADAPADDLVERLEAREECGCGACEGTSLVNPDGPEARDRIRSLEAQRDEAVRAARGLSTAISWLDAPFIDSGTNEPELRSRIEFMLKDAEKHRAFLDSLKEGRHG